MTLGEYAELWLSIPTYGESTREQTATVWRHITQVLGDALGGAPGFANPVLAAEQAAGAGPSTVRLLFSTLSSILGSGVEDERIAKNPCRASSLRLPKIDERRRTVPWANGQVVALRAALPDRYRIMLALTTGLGLRQGEDFGLAVEQVDFLRQVVRVQRQVSIVGNRLVLALPEGRKVREVPLPSQVGRGARGPPPSLPGADRRCRGRSERGGPKPPDSSSRVERAGRRIATTSTAASGSQPSAPQASRTCASRGRRQAGTSTRASSSKQGPA